MIRNIVSYFIPPLLDRLDHNYRAKVAEDLRSYLKRKNLNFEWNDYKDFDLDLWTSDDFSVGQIIVKHKNSSSNLIQPFHFLIGKNRQSSPISPNLPNFWQYIRLTSPIGTKKTIFN